jgi:glycosidase
MVDRFQDEIVPPVVAGADRCTGMSAPNSFYGGTIKGVTRNLGYIAGLGCTAIWLSPVFENNADAYHGYDINNYLRIDPHFGTKQDLIDLVEAAHGFKRNDQPFPIRIILDVVINHYGDNWHYPGGFLYFYSDDSMFDFWRFPAG